MKIEIYDTPDLLAEAAASLWIKLSRQAIARKGCFFVSLSGGSTPRRLFTLLAQEPFRSEINWQQCYIFFGDERCVPHDHAESNYRMARETLLDKVDAPHVFPIPTNDVNEANIRQYASTLIGEMGQPPVFDLVFLGLGADGHTASLFPGTGAINITDREVLAVYVEKMNSWRISLSLPVINHARNVAFLVEGEGKADIVKEIIQDKPGVYPAEKIQPDGELLWCLDKAAAEKLK